MSISKDAEQTYNRFGVYIDELKCVMAKYGVRGEGWRSYPRLLAALKKTEARDEIGEILKVVVALDGGKVAVATVGMVVALSIGGVGVAMMGTAYGLSAATITFVGTACGALLGNEFDAIGGTKRLMEKIGFAPNGTPFWRSLQLEHGSESLAEISSGIGTERKSAGDYSTKGRLADEDGSGSESVAMITGLIKRIEMRLDSLDLSQRRSEVKNEEFLVKISALENLLAKSESLVSVATSVTTAKLEDFGKRQASMEQLIIGQGLRVASLQERVDRSRSDQAALNGQTQETLVGLHRASDWTLLALFVITSLLIALVVISGLLLRRH